MTWIAEKARELCESERARHQHEVLWHQAELHAAQDRKQQQTDRHTNRLRARSVLFALVIGVMLQAITIPVLCWKCKDEHYVPTTTVVRDPYPGDIWHLGLNKDPNRTKTVAGIETIWVTNYTKVAIWDILLSSAAISIIAFARFKALVRANPAPQDDRV
jgi:hypothetical protein